MISRPAPGRGRLVLLPVALLCLSGCTGVQSTLNTAGPSSARLAALWWSLFAMAVIVFVVVMGLLVVALVLRRGTDVRPRRGGERTVVLAGVVIPLIILLGVYGGTLHVMQAEQNPPRPARLTVEVTGHDWWWEVRYPQSGLVTANEIHVPVGQAVDVRVRTVDVIHSFWVPSITYKQDMIPGKDNHLWLQADRAGVYRGQCAEYCGAEHAGMAFLVIAEPPAQFQAWLTQESAGPGEPSSALARRGQQVFQQVSCAACHAIQGTTAQGILGPDLTHFGSRRTLGAGVAPNDPGWLGGWIANSQTIKPGNLMPPQPLAPTDLRALIAYLEDLK